MLVDEKVVAAYSRGFRSAAGHENDVTHHLIEHEAQLLLAHQDCQDASNSTLR